jgi:hypothetical protein
MTFASTALNRGGSFVHHSFRRYALAALLCPTLACGDGLVTTSQRGAASVGPAAHLANAQNQSPIILGIGPIVWEPEGTTESFDLVSYLQSHPLQTPCPVEPRLMAFSSNADVALTGRIDGKMTFIDHDRPQLAMLWVIPPLIPLTIFYLHTFEYDTNMSARFLVRSHGAAPRTIEAAHKEEIDSRHNLVSVQDFMFMPLWDQLATQLEKDLTAVCTGVRS